MSDHEPHDTSAGDAISRFVLTRRAWLARAAGVGATAGLLGPRAVLAQGTPKRGGTLRVATVDKPVNMDPGYAQLYSSLQIYQNVYNKLAYVDEAGQFIPGLAKSWKQENDKTWLFELVDNAVFHNGEPFTAQDVVFTFTRLPLGQWRSARTTNAIERLHEEFKRRIKTQTVLPSADTAAMLFWALLASGQISMRKVDCWHTLATKLIDQPIDLAA